MSKAKTTKSTASFLSSDPSYDDLVKEVAEMQVMIRVKNTELNKSLRYAGVLEKMLETPIVAKTAFEMLPSVVKFSQKVTKIDIKKIKQPARLTAHLSDLHIGTLIKKGSVISQPHVEFHFARLEEYFKHMLEFMLHEVKFSHVYDYTGVVVLFNGDLLNGEHLSESVRTNETNVQETLQKGIQMCSEFLMDLSSGLKELGMNIPIKSIFTAGNHGRWDHNCPSGDFAIRNFDTYLGTGVRDAIKSANSVLKKAKVKQMDIDITVAADHEALFRVYGHNYLVTHGNFAASNAMLRKREKISSDLTSRLYVYKLGAEKRFSSTLDNKPITGVFVGHFHQQVNDRRYGVFVNGSPKGYDHYAEKLNLNVEPAMQSCHVLTRNGVVQSFDINLEQPFRPAEIDDQEGFENLTVDINAHR